MYIYADTSTETNANEDWNRNANMYKIQWILQKQIQTLKQLRMGRGLLQVTDQW